MKLKLSDPLFCIGITCVVSTIPALASTVYRLWIRRRNLWADDILALCSTVSLAVLVAGCFIHILARSPHRVMVAAYYIISTSFYTAIWFARLSILFSIVRVDPVEARRRRLLILAFIFCLITLVLEAQLFWVCEQSTGWKEKNNPQCLLPLQVAILQLATDIIADVILIAAPLRLLRSLNDVSLRRRLTVIFSTCLVTTVVSLVHAAFVCVQGGPKSIIAAVVETCVSVIVCNIPLVITSLLRIRREPSVIQSRLQFATWNSKTTTRDVASANSTVQLPGEIVVTFPESGTHESDEDVECSKSRQHHNGTEVDDSQILTQHEK